MKIKQAVGTFCSNQPFSLEFIKTRQKKDSRFNAFIQVRTTTTTTTTKTLMGRGEKYERVCVCLCVIAGNAAREGKWCLKGLLQ